ncbi:response regulator [Vibrio sp. SM6]|uniref:Response regulator n=1 Tax=Vibrio agarilyticus TaxID=2726741 RepID=A0A7X8YF61_9VIBR|nr:response regulator [Vibrio agarilyticus]NLS11334.1 response regulator [Vibrio agarilyticus]
MRPYQVLLVDDHPLMRRGLKQLLSFEADFDVIAEASSGTEAVALNRQYMPDLILLDLNMKGMSGLDTLRALRTDECDAAIVILTVSNHPADIDALVAAGADGYLLKDSDPDELVTLLQQSLRGEKAYSSEVATYLISRENTTDDFAELTDREGQILRLVAKGLRNRDIAETLYISESTVKVHMKSLLKKLGVPSRAAAMVRYFERYGDVS